MTLLCGIGMVSSLGTDAYTACAAARAGLVRSCVSENFGIRSGVDGAREPVIVHEASVVTSGFEGEGRRLRLLAGALKSLGDSVPHVKADGGGIVAFLTLADPARTLGGSELILDEAVRSARMSEIENSEVPQPDAERAQRLFRRACELSGWAEAPQLGQVFHGAAAAALEMLSVAREFVLSGRARIAVAIALDSLLDEETLSWLHICGRLKCDASPLGLQPGEAAVALAFASASVSSDSCAFEPGAAPVVIGPTHRAIEKRALIRAETSVGEGLGKAMSAAYRVDNTAAPWLVLDHNGESYRANELGYALVRVRAEFESFADVTIWYPALSFGDAGVAAPLLGVALAARAFQRGYAPSRSALVCACSETGERACTIVRAAA